jgi:hypothetical protein
MWPLDRPTDREVLVFPRQRIEAPAGTPGAEIADLYDDDPLAAARGAVNGTLCGAIVWAVILWVLL